MNRFFKYWQKQSKQFLFFIMAFAALIPLNHFNSAHAAGLLIADGGFGGVLEIKEHDVQVTINNGVAVTQVTQIFKNTENRQVEALGNLGDMLIVMSTSGNSENLVRAVAAARQKQAITAGLLGGDGGQLAKQVDRALVIPHPMTQRIQEEHLFMVHQLVELVERDLFA